MPIFEYNGVSYRVKDEHIDKFAEKYPDAYAHDSINGEKYKVKPSRWKAFAEEKATKEKAKADEDFLRSQGIGEETIRKGKEILGLVEKEEAPAPKEKAKDPYASAPWNTADTEFNKNQLSNFGKKLEGGMTDEQKANREVLHQQLTDETQKVVNEFGSEVNNYESNLAKIDERIKRRQAELHDNSVQLVNPFTLQGYSSNLINDSELDNLKAFRKNVTEGKWRLTNDPEKSFNDWVANEEAKKVATEEYNAKIADIDAKIDAKKKELSDARKTAQSVYSIGRTTPTNAYGQIGQAMSRPESQEEKDITHDLKVMNATKEVLQNIYQHRENARRYGEGRVVEDALTNLADSFFDRNTWSFGLKDLSEATALKDVYSKVDRGEALTDAEQLLFDTYNDYANTQKMEVGASAAVGKTVGQMAPFMVEMAINPARGASGAAAKSYARAVLQQFGKQAVKNNAKKYVAGKLLTTGLTDLGAGLVMSATTGAAMTEADAQRKMMGDVMTDMQGNYIGRTNQMSEADARTDALISGAIERQSELLGSHFLDPLTGKMGKWFMGSLVKGENKYAGTFVGKWLSGTQKAIKNYGKTPVYKFFDGVNKMTHYNGAVNEYLEEVIGNMERATAGIDGMEFSTEKGKGVFNPEDNAVTFLSVAIPGVAQATINTVATGVYVYNRIDKAQRQGAEMFGSRWNVLKSQLDEIDMHNPKSAYAQMMSVCGRITNTEGRAAAVEYVKAKAMVDTFESTSQSLEQEKEDDLDIATTEAQTQGREAVTPEQVRAVGKSIEDAESALLAVNSGDAIKQTIDRHIADGATDARQMSAVFGALDEDARQSAEDYFFASVELQSKAEEVQSRIDAKVKEKEDEIAPYIYNNESGARMYAKATLTTGQKEDKKSRTIYFKDYDSSAEKLFYYDEDGSVQMIARNDAELSDLQEVNYDEYINQYREEVSNMIDSAEDAMLSHSPKTNQALNAGDVIETAQGRMQVLGNDGNGNVTLAPVQLNKQGQMEVVSGSQPLNISAEDAMRVQDEFYEAPTESEAVLQSTESVDNVSANQAQNEGIASGEGEQSVSKPTVEPIPTIQNGKKSRVAYEQVPVARTIEEVYGQFDEQEEVDEFIDLNIAEAEAAVKNASKPKPKMSTDIEAYKQAKAKWQEEQAGLAEAQKRLDYWNEVKAESERMQGLDIVTEIPQETKKDDNAPRSAMEYVASMIGRLDPESYRKETGYGVKEQRKAGPIFLKKENGGMTVEGLAEWICEQPEAQEWGIQPGMDSEVRDMIIEVLSHGSPKAYIRDAHAQQAKADAYGEEQYLENMAAAQGYASADDMIAHDEVFLAEAIRAHYGLENSGFYDNLAEEYEQEDNRRYGQGNERQDNSGSAERLEESDSTGAGQNDSGSGEVLSEEQSADTTGATVGSTGQTSESSGIAEGSAESVAENEAVSGESGDVSSAERTEMESRIVEWLSEENLSRAKGKTREEIFNEFGNELMPIAYIPNKYISLMGANIKDQRIYCGKGYFIDHALRNHADKGAQSSVDEIDVSKYLNMQAVLDNPDHIKETYVDGKRTVVFIKKIGRYFAELTQVEENGRIVLHKSFFNQKKEPYAKLSDIRFGNTSSEGGVSSISHTANAVPAISLESRGDVMLEESSSDSKNNASSVDNKAEGEKVLQDDEKRRNIVTQIAKNSSKIRRIFGAPKNASVEQFRPATTMDPDDVYDYYEVRVTDGQLERLSRLFEERDALKAELKEIDSKIAMRKQSEAPKVESPSEVENDNFIPYEEQMKLRIEQWEKTLGVKVVVYTDPSQVKSRTVRAEWAKGELTPGWFSNGTAYIFLPHNNGVKSIDETFVHEVVSHKGIKELLGEEGFNKFLDGVWNMMSAESRAEFLGYVGGSAGVVADQRAAADEYVAHLSEAMSGKLGKGLSSSEKSVWNKIVDFFRNLFASQNQDLADAILSKEVLTDKDIKQMIMRSFESLREKAKGSSEAMPQSTEELSRPIQETNDTDDLLEYAKRDAERRDMLRKVYHGSGASFDKFDHSHMGEGEGAQAFGWGTYVTDVEGIGRTYAKSSFMNNLFKEDNDWATSRNMDPVVLSATLVRHTMSINNMSFEEAKKDIIKNAVVEDDMPDYIKEVSNNLIEATKNLSESDLEKAESGAHLYTVEIPDDNGSNYIVYDKDVSKKVKDNVKRSLFDILVEGDYKGAEKELKWELDTVFATDMDGRDLYGTVSSYLGSDKETSQFFNSIGFVGISYPAEFTSGGRSDGARNYVIFNEEDAKIEGHMRFRKLKEVNDKFNARLLELDKDREQKDRVLRLGKPSQFLLDGGVVDADMEMEFDKFVRKSSDKYENGHPFTVNDIMDLPIAINYPIAVFDSTNGRDKVILTELKKDGMNFIVAIKAVPRRRKGGVVLEVNEIATLYPKKAKGIVNWINNGLTANIEKKKALEWLGALRTNHGTELNNQELDSATKVIEEFENPKLSEENEETKFKKYKSKDGKETAYRQLSLFDTEGEASNDRLRSDSVQRKGDTRLATLNSLRELEEGEVCNVERKFIEKGGFDFTRGEKITSVQDIAYIFKNLEDEAIENTFVAFVKGKNVTVLQLGMGSQVSTLADTSAIVAGADRLNADKVYFVHNHPSGKLMCSPEDVNLYNNIKFALGDKLQDGIIINTRSGKYGLFNGEGVVSLDEKHASPQKEYPLKIYGFNKQAFHSDVVRVTPSSNGIAEFISTQRLGSRDKINALLLDNNFGCVGNVFLSETDITSKNAYSVMNKLVSDAISMGARGIVIYGRAPFLSLTDRKVNINPRIDLSEYVRRLSIGNVKLYDVIQLGVVTLSANDEGFRFRKANRNQVGFVSNAMVAVENVKQDKATSEQWLKMIEKQGGLKASEDKWLGLSDWLKSSDKKTLTKDEVLEFIGENMIQIEEVKYKQDTEADYADKLAEFNAEFSELIGLGEEETGSLYTSDFVDYAWSAMVERYGDDFESAFEIDYDGENSRLVPQFDYDGSLVGAARYFLDIEESNPIDSTRLDYTTDGLENKREIALTVPTIEPWNESDEIHFGDAGNGRAVAWVRFGETTDADGSKVLVIDEIQSKRHQEGREKGYVDKSRMDEIRNLVAKNDERLNEITPSIKTIYNGNKELGLSGAQKQHEEAVSKLPKEQRSEYEKLKEENYSLIKEFTSLQKEGETGIPSAPFEKNWHELAMKRMLRLAAEEGFDKVAWTTGEQQAERYDIGDAVKNIEVNAVTDSETGEVLNDEFDVYTRSNANGGGFIPEATGRMSTEQIMEVFGKDLGGRIVENGRTQKNAVIEGENLRLGGDGMKGFYDKMLPSFVQKYTKKWGAKVGEVTLPNLEEPSQKMWSVDVTPQMKESVEEQVMFSKKPAEIEAEEAKLSRPVRETNDTNDLVEYAKRDARRREELRVMGIVGRYAKSRWCAPVTVLVDEEDAKEKLSALGASSELIDNAVDIIKGDILAGGYNKGLKRIFIFAGNSEEEIVTTLKHENTHALLDLLSEDDFNALYDALKNVYPKTDAKIRKRYLEEFPDYTERQLQEELVTLTLEYRTIDSVRDKLSDKGLDVFNNVVEIVGYEQKEDDSSRRGRTDSRAGEGSGSTVGGTAEEANREAEGVNENSGSESKGQPIDLVEYAKRDVERRKRLSKVEAPIEEKSDIRFGKRSIGKMATEDAISTLAQKYGLKGIYPYAVIDSIEDIESLKGVINDEVYKKLIKSFNDNDSAGVSYINSGVLFLFGNRLHSKEDAKEAYWHENTHIIYRDLKFSDREQYDSAILDWLKRFIPGKYEEIINDYEESDWGEEAAANFIAITIKKYGEDYFFEAKFEGESILTNFAELIQHALKYGARQTNQTQGDKLQRLFQVSNDKGRSGANAENKDRQNRSEQERKRKNAEDAAGTYRQAQPIYLVAYALQKVNEREVRNSARPQQVLML